MTKSMIPGKGVKNVYHSPWTLLASAYLPWKFLGDSEYYDYSAAGFHFLEQQPTDSRQLTIVFN